MQRKYAGEGLKRVIGVPALAATVINNTIGAGIYALPAIVSIQMGAAGILGYLFCGGMLMAIMLCYVEIGSKINVSGGSYIYVEKAFGPFAGFVVNWLFFFGYGALSSAAVINILADSLSVLFPAFSNPLTRALLYFILLGIMVLVNVAGTKQSVRFLQYITVLKLLPLLGIIIFGFGYVKIGNLHWTHFPGLDSMGKTALVLFFAFAGFETSLGPSGEIKNPKRTVPRGILLGGAVVFVVYLLIQTISQGVLGGHISDFKDAPLAAVAENIVGPIGATILLMGAIVSCLGNVGGDMLGTPRLLYAAANDRLFPKYLCKVHARFATPYWSVISYAGLIFIFSVSGGFKELAVLASCALLLIYLAVILSMIRLRTKNEAETEKSFKVPAGLLIPFTAIAAIIWLLSRLSGKEILSTIVFIAMVCLIYFFMKRFQNKEKVLQEPEAALPADE